MNNKVLVIIPARGGSKGIPRKNLRNLAGKPLITYAVNNALSSSFSPDVYVSSEDAEIISIANKLGAKTILRDERDSLDSTTLDPVIFNSLKNIEGMEEKEYDIVVTLQPTSPLLKTKTIDSAIHQLINNSSADTLISAVDDTHLTWSKINNKYKPNYKARLNRQELPNVFKETGGFLITRAECITSNSRIGPNVELVSVSEKESIDIDTFADWGLCEYYLRRKKLIFVVSGYREIGLGHVYNTLLLANDLIEHEISFLVDSKSQLAFEKISSKISNKIRTIFTNDGMDDSCCPLKIIKTDCAKKIPMFKGLHRFLPAMVLLQKGTVLQIPIQHFPRIAGKTKFGIRNRLLGPITDCFAYLWMKRKYINYKVAKHDI